MATNPFSATSEVNNKVPRNTHDLSFQNSITFGFGTIVPVLCQEVFAGNAYQIQPILGLRTLPMVFPVQTRMKARLHYFYVRNRTLWKDWMDFQFGTKSGLVPPTIAKNSNLSFANGSLADYLNVPTMLYTDQSFQIKYDVVSNPTIVFPSSPTSYTMTLVNGNVATDFRAKTYRELIQSTVPSDIAPEYKAFCFTLDASPFISADPTSTIELVFSFTGNLLSSPVIDTLNSVVQAYDGFNDTIAIRQILVTGHSLNTTTYKCKLKVADVPPTAERLVFIVKLTSGDIQGDRTAPVFTCQSAGAVTFPNGVELSNLPKSFNPFINGKRPLLALPFRAYESIYNSFYRNQLLDPFMLNGKPEYNKFIPNEDGGEDSTVYGLHNINWEDDAFTTCLPSPQQGPAPIVGIVDSGSTKVLAFQDEDGVVRRVSPVRTKDGITAFNVSDDTNDVITFTRDEIAQGLLSATQGITINDFRNVNALTKYLELNQRKGFRYKDLVKGHYDVDIKYEELGYPEFIGGTTKDVYVNPVTATAATPATDNSPSVVLGDYAGQAGIVGEGKSFTKYCDENGFIIGLCVVTPVPVYTQTLPKHFTKLSQFDYFSPEFANVGYQPLNKELLCPLQYFNDEQAQTTKVFGYQRPWWEYIANTDQAHGLFRSSLRNFLMHRTFNSVPELGREFIQCDQSQLNDVFATSMEKGHKILGEIYHKIEVKSAVPFISIPQLD